MKTLPWFRMYHEAIDDEKLRLLAFEDRWHFVAILCLKCKGVLDTEPDAELLQRKVALKMGLTCAELENVMKRLSRMGLVNAETYQPAAWDERQARSDRDETNAERQARYRQTHKKPVTDSNALRNGAVTGIEEEEEEEEEVEEDKKNTRAVAQPDGVSDSVWQDFKAIRKTKKAAITTTAINKIRAQAAKAGVSLQVALETCCERGWASFNADWAGVSKVAQPETYKERDDRIARTRWEEMTGQRHPENLQNFINMPAVEMLGVSQ